MKCQEKMTNCPICNSKLEWNYESEFTYRLVCNNIACCLIAIIYIV